MKVRATFLKADRRVYPRKGGNGEGVAHTVTIITPDGTAGKLFLGGDTERGVALYQSAMSIGQGQQVEIEFGFSEFRGDLRPDVIGLAAVK